jgi:hypothetical protein
MKYPQLDHKYISEIVAPHASRDTVEQVSEALLEVIARLLVDANAKLNQIISQNDQALNAK